MTTNAHHVTLQFESLYRSQERQNLGRESIMRTLQTLTRELDCLSPATEPRITQHIKRKFDCHRICLGEDFDVRSRLRGIKCCFGKSLTLAKEFRGKTASSRSG